MKTIGVTDPIRNALHTLAEDIRAAFVYGSVAKATDKAGSDIDLMVVSDRLSHADLFEILEPVESALGRSISPTVMSLKEWRTKRANRGSFASRIASGPKLFVLGDESDLV